MFQERPVIRHLVRYPIDEHGIVARLVHACAAEFQELRHDAGIAAIDFVDECRRKGPFAADDEPDFLHENSSPPPPFFGDRRLRPPPLWGRIGVGGVGPSHPHPNPPPSRGRDKDHFCADGNSTIRMLRKSKFVVGSWPCRLIAPLPVLLPLRALSFGGRVSVKSV